MFQIKRERKTLPEFTVSPVDTGSWSEVRTTCCRFARISGSVFARSNSSALSSYG